MITIGRIDNLSVAIVPIDYSESVYPSPDYYKKKFSSEEYSKELAYITKFGVYNESITCSGPSSENILDFYQCAGTLYKWFPDDNIPHSPFSKILIIQGNRVIDSFNVPMTDYTSTGCGDKSFSTTEFRIVPTVHLYLFFIGAILIVAIVLFFFNKKR